MKVVESVNALAAVAAQAQWSTARSANTERFVGSATATNSVTIDVVVAVDVGVKTEKTVVVRFNWSVEVGVAVTFEKVVIFQPKVWYAVKASRQDS